MSYCRWSSDFNECDVYVYEDVSGGWTTHVAGRRLKHKVPDEIKNMPVYDDEGRFSAEKFLEQHKAIDAWRESLPCDELPAQLPDGTATTCKTPKDSEYMSLSAISEYAGQSYNDPTPGECADRLEEIRASGLNVPQYAIDALREEQSTFDE